MIISAVVNGINGILPRFCVHFFQLYETTHKQPRRTIRFVVIITMDLKDRHSYSASTRLITVEAMVILCTGMIKTPHCDRFQQETSLFSV